MESIVDNDVVVVGLNGSRSCNVNPYVIPCLQKCQFSGSCVLLGFCFPKSPPKKCQRSLELFARRVRSELQCIVGRAFCVE